MTINSELEKVLCDNKDLIANKKLTSYGLLIELHGDILNNCTKDFLMLEIALRPFHAKWQGTLKHSFLIPSNETKQETAIIEKTLSENSSVERTIQKLKQHFTPLPMSDAEIKEALSFLLEKKVPMREIAASTGASMATLYRIAPKKPKEKLSREKNATETGACES